LTSSTVPDEKKRSRANRFPNETSRITGRAVEKASVENRKKEICFYYFTWNQGFEIWD
jgi:hypothetical protein